MLHHRRVRSTRKAAIYTTNGGVLLQRFFTRVPNWWSAHHGGYCSNTHDRERSGTKTATFSLLQDLAAAVKTNTAPQLLQFQTFKVWRLRDLANPEVFCAIHDFAFGPADFYRFTLLFYAIDICTDFRKYLLKK